MSKVRHIRVDNETWSKWEERAKAVGLTVSALVRYVMEINHPQRIVYKFPDQGEHAAVKPTPHTAEEIERVNNQFGDFSNDPESYKGQIEAHDRMSKAVTAHWKPPMPSAPKHEVRPIGKIAKKLKGGK